MRLHFAQNTIAVAVAVALEEAGIDYEPVEVRFAEAEQTKPDYLAINPKGRVPALETEGAILTETGALLDYIGAKAPQAKLVPQDVLQAAQMRSVMYYLASTAHINHAHKMRGHRWADQQSSFDDMTQKVPETMTTSAQFIEDRCLTGPFVLGADISIADPYLFIIASWLEGDGVALANFPKISAFLEMMNARASVVAVRDKGILTL